MRKSTGCSRAGTMSHICKHVRERNGEWRYRQFRASGIATKGQTQRLLHFRKERQDYSRSLIYAKYMIILRLSGSAVYDTILGSLWHVPCITISSNVLRNEFTSRRFLRRLQK